MTGQDPNPVPEGPQKPGRWGDLGVRVASGLALAGLGVVSVYAGGWIFLAMAAAAFAVMAWELAALTDPPGASLWRLVIAGLAFGGLILAQGGGGLLLALVLAPAALAATPRRDKALLAFYLLAMLVAAHEFILLDKRGGIIVVWLVCLVVVSDVMGYFAGRLIGGPRFWPAISPKKTWAGTVAGWIGAVVLGAGFALWQGGGWGLAVISPLVAFAGQLGDILESLIKRRAGLKDVSRLIPGHGGLLDRFDALIGAILAVMLLELAVPLPLGVAG